MPLFLRRSDGDMPEYAVIYRADDERELYVGHISKLYAVKDVTWT